ncbi:DinB family protein [bacterium AH-315-F03]|nr:DinB family protein [bacterium AH-315-F03]
MRDVDGLISEVGEARQEVLDAARRFTLEQQSFKPVPGSWSLSEILEHLVLAEHVGINFIWRAVVNYKQGGAVSPNKSPNNGLSIDEIITNTWQLKETAPESATPSLGGPTGFWIVTLESLQSVLEQLGTELKTVNICDVIFSHFLCGPLDAGQRLQFLRFHLDRHLKQIEALENDQDFPV